MGSDQWFRQFERELNELEGAGLTYEEASKIADRRARNAVVDQVTDKADRDRKRAKGE